MSTSEICRFDELPAGAVFRFEHAIALKYDELRLKLPNKEVRNLHPTLEKVSYVAQDEWLTVPATAEEQLAWTKIAEDHPLPERAPPSGVSL